MQPFFEICILLLQVQFFKENLCLCLHHVAQIRNMTNPMKCGPSNNILIQLTIFSFLQYFRNSHTFLAFTTSTELQNFLCFFMSYKFDEPTPNDLAGLMICMMFVVKSRNWHSDSIFMEGEVAVYNCCNTIHDEVARAPHMICMSLW
jgi:hypothetical protein